MAAEAAGAFALAGLRAGLGLALGASPSGGGARGAGALGGGFEGSAWAAGLPGSGLRGVREGARLLRWGLEPYASGRCSVPPLALAALVPLVEGPLAGPLAPALFSAALDTLSAAALLRAGRALGLRGRSAWAAPAAHLLSPLTAAASWSGARVALESCSFYWALAAALAGRPTAAAFPAALAAYLGASPLLLALPVGLVLHRGSGPGALSGARNPSGRPGSAGWFAALTLLWLAVLLWLSSALAQYWLAAARGGAGSSSGGLAGPPSLTDGLRYWMGRSYGVWFSLEDLSPNLGLFWYFFAEVMGPFRNYFLALLHLQPFLLLPPLALALRGRPLLFTLAVAVLQSLFRPHPSSGDAAQFMALAPLVPELAHVPPTKIFTLASVFAYVYTLGPLFLDLWVESGVANANFFYSITLVSAAGHILALSVAVSAAAEPPQAQSPTHEKQLSSGTHSGSPSSSEY